MPAPRDQASFDPAPETRERILTIAARLFTERGYDQTSLSHVAREARVSKALVLWHFDRKDTLFRAALGRTLEPFFIDAETLQGLDEAAQIASLIDQFYEFVQENVYSVRFLLSVIVDGEQQQNEVVERVSELYRIFRELLAGVIREGRAKGRFRCGVDPELDGSLILTSLAGILIEHFIARDRARDPARLLSHLKETAISRLLA
jgi:AcrR family transcriptional regulator